MKNITTLICGFLFIISSQLVGQNKLAIELRGGVDFPTQDFGTLDIDAGSYFQIAVGYPIVSNLGAFAGVHLAGYPEMSTGSSSDNLFAETGYFAGLELSMPLTENKLDMFFRGSIMKNAINVFDDDGDKLAESSGKIGWQFEAGLDFSIGNNWSIRPGLRYHELDQTITNDFINIEDKLNGISFFIGAAVRI